MTFDINPLIQAKLKEINQRISEGVEEGAAQHLESLGWIRPSDVQKLQDRLDAILTQLKG